MKICFLIYPLLIFGLFALGLPSRAAAQPEPGYQITQAIAVWQKAGECDCTIQVLEDDRITDAIRKNIQETSYENVGDEESEKLYAPFNSVPMRDAAVRIVDRNGIVLDRRAFDMPIAELENNPQNAKVETVPLRTLYVKYPRDDMFYHFIILNKKFA